MKFALCLTVAGIGFLTGKPARAAVIKLPMPRPNGRISVEEALRSRRSQRSYQNKALSPAQVSQLLWAAYGITARRGSLSLKTSPSAGALYPINVYAVVGNQGVLGLAAGVYHYNPETHDLTALALGDARSYLAQAAQGQIWLARAPMTLVVTGEYARSEIKYSQRGRMFTHIESGCVGQNVFLQAEALGLKAGMIGAFVNKQVIESLMLPPNHDPLLLMPVGYPR